jgi:hypothetical protein
VRRVAKQGDAPFAPELERRAIEDVIVQDGALGSCREQLDDGRVPAREQLEPIPPPMMMIA